MHFCCVRILVTLTMDTFHNPSYSLFVQRQSAGLHRNGDRQCFGINSQSLTERKQLCDLITMSCDWMSFSSSSRRRSTSSRTGSVFGNWFARWSTSSLMCEAAEVSMRFEKCNMQNNVQYINDSCQRLKFKSKIVFNTEISLVNYSHKLSFNNFCCHHSWTGAVSGAMPFTTRKHFGVTFSITQTPCSGVL